MIKIWRYQRQGKNILRKEEYIALSAVAKSSSKMAKGMSLLALAIRRSLLSEAVEVKAWFHRDLQWMACMNSCVN